MTTETEWIGRIRGVIHTQGKVFDMDIEATEHVLEEHPYFRRALELGAGAEAAEGFQSALAQVAGELADPST